VTPGTTDPLAALGSDIFKVGDAHAFPYYADGDNLHTYNGGVQLYGGNSNDYFAGVNYSALLLADTGSPQGVDVVPHLTGGFGA
jgi:hypothetical protein